MIGGSSAYTNVTNNVSELLPTNHALQLNNDVFMYNIDKFSPYSPFFVRESGVYIFFICINTDNTAQFSIFINGVITPNTCVGTNSGAGQLVSRHLLKLNKDDNIIIRNYISAVPSISININVGGLQVGNSAVVVGFKIAPLYPAIINKCNEPSFKKSLTHKKKKLFKKLTEKLVCDKTLMPKGFNITGSFFNKDLQLVSTESEVIFNNTNAVNGLIWDPLLPTKIKIIEDGIYKLFFLVNTNTAGQFSIGVDGVPLDYTTQGTNRGAGQLTVRAIVELKQNQIVIVINHTSANSVIVVPTNAGGEYPSVNVILTIR
jgi:hypothetical protein